MESYPIMARLAGRGAQPAIAVPEGRVKMKPGTGITRASDVARKLGLGRTTVSHVLNGRGTQMRISPETQRRIWKAARALGYRSNSAAKAILTGRFGCAALLTSTVQHRSSVSPVLLNGLHDALAHHNMHLTFARLPDGDLTDPLFVPKILREWMADGILIKYDAAIPEKLVALVNEYRLPSIWLNSKQSTDCVYPNDAAGASGATEYLLNLGHKRIAFVQMGYDTATHPNTHYSAIDRRVGYEQVMKAAGLASQILPVVPVKEWYSYLQQLLRSPDRPTALVCIGEEFQAAAHAAEICGLTLGRDISVIAFSQRQVRLDGRMATTWIVPDAGMADMGVTMLLQKIQQPEEDIPPMSLPFTYEVGFTTGPYTSNS